MHISEGILTSNVIIGGYVLTGVGTFIGQKELQGDKIITTAVISTVFFVSSFIHVPVGVGSVHLILNGIAGLILGWRAFCALLIALLLQGILFQFGGITTLGVNTFNMAMPAVITYYLFRKFIVSPKRILRLLSGFLAGSFSVFGSALLLSFSLYLSGDKFLSSAKMIFIVHIPVIIIEGIITAFVVDFLYRTNPKILNYVEDKI